MSFTFQLGGSKWAGGLWHIHRCYEMLLNKELSKFSLSGFRSMGALDLLLLLPLLYFGGGRELLNGYKRGEDLW